MSDDAPTPPDDLPTDLVDGLDGRSADQLRAVARYAETLADYRERAGDPAEESEEDETDDPDADEVEDLPDDRPAGVPGKATITVKEINDNRYYYWQWREGDSVKSQYEGPVDAAE